MGKASKKQERRKQYRFRGRRFDPAIGVPFVMEALREGEGPLKQRPPERAGPVAQAKRYFIERCALEAGAHPLHAAVWPDERFQDTERGEQSVAHRHVAERLVRLR